MNGHGLHGIVSGRPSEANQLGSLLEGVDLILLEK